jgi:hypothetical protein
MMAKGSSRLGIAVKGCGTNGYGLGIVDPAVH